MINTEIRKIPYIWNNFLFHVLAITIFFTNSNIDKHIDKLKNKNNEYKNIRQILTTELFEKQKQLGDMINSTKSNKTALELKNVASDYFFVKGLGNDAGLDMEI